MREQAAETMMDLQFLQFLREVEAELSALPVEDFSFLAADRRTSHQEKVIQLLTRLTGQLSPREKRRVLAEFTGLGPLEELMEDQEITEIMVNGPQSLWIEKGGQVLSVPDGFCSEGSFRNSFERLAERANSHITIERPMASGHLPGFRVQVVGGELTRGAPSLCLRRHPDNPWTLEKLAALGWACGASILHLRNWIKQRKNFLVLGSTGSGKTSVVNACLQELAERDRALILEDTQELSLPNGLSQRLLTREDPQRILPDISLSDLVKQALRLRPDRLVVGEMRGGEAKDFLMALSTGHRGSFGTLHASSPHQGLIRLEMLIQMGAPHWNLQAIRRLIQLSLDGLVVVGREANGNRALQGLYQITALEETGFLIEPLAC
ncbi:MAG: CpaF family protein [Bdellovibrio sp.]|nr:MAG: CpaF family protein [Bdellovibrio sp.]